MVFWQPAVIDDTASLTPNLHKNQFEMARPITEQDLRDRYTKKLETIRRILPNYDKFDCFICSTVPENPKVKLSCSHAFCLECLTLWCEVKGINWGCPVCKAPLQISFLQRQYNK